MRFGQPGAIVWATRGQSGPRRIRGGHWGTLGTAIDYRLRYYFPPPLEGRSLVASLGMAMLSGVILEGGIDRPDTGLWQRLGQEFLTRLAAVEDRAGRGDRLPRTLEDTLCRHCFALALFEQQFRAGPHVGSVLFTLADDATVSDLLNLAPAPLIADLRGMSWAFHDGFADLLTKPAILNPTFAGSVDIGGADADLIVEGCLLEIKATVEPRALPSEVVYQLIGYVLLDYSNEFAIDSVGIYMARQAVLVRWSLQELLTLVAGREASLARLRREFRSLLGRDDRVPRGRSVRIEIRPG